LLKTQNSKQTWPQRVWKLWKQTFFHVVLFVCFPANFCFKLVGPEFVFRVETNFFRKRLFSFQKQTFLKNSFLFVFRHTDNPGGKLLFSSGKLTFRNFCFRVKKRLFSIVLVVLGHSLGTGLATHNSKRLRHAHRHRRIRQRHIRHRHIRPRHSPPAPPHPASPHPASPHSSGIAASGLATRDPASPHIFSVGFAPHQPRHTHRCLLFVVGFALPAAVAAAAAAHFFQKKV
jgi:hypothetical protein